MKFSLSWLKDYLETDWSADQLAEKMTAIGLEVEAVTNPAEALAPFRIARVLSAEKHPEADKLQLLMVDPGDGQPLQVVCGAPNARAGLVGVFGGVGTFVPGSGFTLKKATIRGVESNGMMCSARELELGDDHDGIIELDPDSPVGASFADFAGLNDPVFDVAITPNRPDCMGVRGIARDLAAAGAGRLKPLEIDAIAGAGPCPVAVAIADPDGCAAFYGRSIKGVVNGPSPKWMQRRLKAAGQRPISAIVDITNYVMLGYGRPAHAYDMAKLSGGLTARRAEESEQVLALNGKTYALKPFMTVIADGSGVHDIGGIMGGEHSSVTETTTDVFLEIAFFTPERIARTGQALGLTSDARTRFERGADPAFLDAGLDLVSRLILDICGGDASEVVRVGTPPLERRTMAFDHKRTAALGGIEVPAKEQDAILERLGFEVEGDRVTVPTWRPDVDGAADLVEEVIRIVGFENIASTPLDRGDGVAHPTATRGQLVERRARRAAAARGLNEAVTWSFIGEAEAEAFGGGAFSLVNPISEELKVMRPSLLPGLIAATRRNLDRGASAVRLFEIGRRYLGEGERPTLTLVMTGDKTPRDWQSGKPADFSAFDAKAEALALLEAAGAPIANLQTFPDAGANWHPGRSAALGLGPKTILARFGELHPSLTRGLPTGTVAAELYLDAIPEARSSGRARSAFAPSALQPVKRDFAFLVPDDLAAGDLVRAIRGSDKAAIADARLFDRFESADGLSLAIEVTLQPAEKSFAEDEIAAISKRVVGAAEALGARLRA